MIILNEEQFKANLYDQYKEKTVFERNKYLYYFVKVGLLNCLLGLTAYFSFNYHFDFWSGYNLPIIDPYFLAIFSTGLIAVVINICLFHLKSEYTRTMNINEFLVIVVACLLGFNVYCDFNGVERIAKDNVINPKGIYDNKIDSLNNYYTYKIEALKTDKNKFIESVTYRGKINIHNQANKTILTGYDTRLNGLINSWNDDKKRLLNESALAGDEYNKTLNASIVSFKYGAMIVSFCILGCVYLIGYIEFKTFEILTENNEKTTVKQPVKQDIEQPVKQLVTDELTNDERIKLASEYIIEYGKASHSELMKRFKINAKGVKKAKELSKI